MNNTYVAKLMAMGVAASTFMTPIVAHADVVITDGAPISSSQKTGGATVTLEDGKTNDLSNPGGADVSEGPKITVKQDKFLIEKGASFDLKSSLGLSVVDAKDGDITDKFPFPPIDTSKSSNFTKVIKAENSEHKKSTKTLVFRVVDIAKAIDVESKEALQTMDLSKVVNGDSQGLTVKLGTIKDNSFTATISDGTNTIEKEIGYTVKQGTTGKPSDTEEQQNTLPTEQTTTPNGETSLPGETTTTPAEGTTTNPSALPQTGVATTTAGIAAGIAAISGVILKKRK